MIKYICEECGKELPEPYSLYTTGHVLCGECLPPWKERNTVDGIVILPPPLYQS